MDHSGYRQYSLARLYKTLDAVTEAENPGLRARIEARIRELEQQEPRLEGIRGWLLPVGICLIATPVRIGRILYGTYFDLFASDTWHSLTTPGSLAYDPAGQRFLMIEMALLLALLAAGVFLSFKFFHRRRACPKWFIGISVVSLLVLAGDLWIARPLFPELPPLSPLVMRELAYDLARCLVGIPYMLMSRRVRQTFTH